MYTAELLLLLMMTITMMMTIKMIITVMLSGASEVKIAGRINANSAAALLQAVNGLIMIGLRASLLNRTHRTRCSNDSSPRAPVQPASPPRNHAHLYSPVTRIHATASQQRF